MTLTELRRRYLSEAIVDATWRDVTVQGVRCEAIVAGNGPPLVLMHGGLDSCMQWTPILPSLAAHFRCYVPERPSNGSSDAFDYRSLDSDFRSHAAMVVADMFDGLGVERAVLVGNSMGALFSLAFAAAHPDRVERVVCVGVPAGHEDHALPTPVRLMAHPLTRRVIAWLSGRAGLRDARRIVRQLMVAHPDRYPDRLLEVTAATTRRNARAWRDFAVRVADRGVLRPDLRSRDWLADLAVPTSYIVGTHDVFGTVQGIRKLADTISADVTVIPGAGHLPWLDEPDLVTSAILDDLGTDSPHAQTPAQHHAR